MYRPLDIVDYGDHKFDKEVNQYGFYPDYDNPNDPATKEEEANDKVDVPDNVGSDQRDNLHSIHDEENPALKIGDKISIQKGISSEILPNKWYSWSFSTAQAKTLFEALNKYDKTGDSTQDIRRYINYDSVHQTLSELTDNSGDLPRILIPSKVSNELIDKDREVLENLGQLDQVPSMEFDIVADKGTTIEHVADPTKPHDVVPSQKPSDVTQPTTPDNIPESPQDSEPYVDDYPEATPVVPINSDTTPVTSNKNVNSNDVTKKTPAVKENNQTKRAYIYARGTFVYDRQGHIVKKYGAFLNHARYSRAKILDNGKVYTIKGKKYYRIGKNRYVRTNSVKQYIVYEKLAVNGTIKASKKHRIRLYTAKGRYTKRTMRQSKKYRFDAKKYIRGLWYYHIKGSRYWIRKYNIKLAK